MKTLFSFAKLALLMTLFSTFAVSSAFATNSGNHKMERKIARRCAKVNGFTFPATKQTILNKTNLATMHACIKQFRQATESCASAQGLLASTGELNTGDAVPYRRCQMQSLASLKPIN